MSQYTLQDKTYEELNDIEKCFYYIIDRLSVKNNKQGICNLHIAQETNSPHKKQSSTLSRIGKSFKKTFISKPYDIYKQLLATNQNNDFYNVDNVMKEMLASIFEENTIKIFGGQIEDKQGKIVCKDDFIHFFENSQDILQFISYCICLIEYYQNDPDQRKQMIIYNAYLYIYNSKDVLSESKENEDDHKISVMTSIASILQQWEGNVVLIETRKDENQSLENELLFTTEDLRTIIKDVQGVEIDLNRKKVDTLNLDKIYIINTKIDNFVQKFPMIKNPIVFADDFNEIYITSDIHADLRKFVQTLIDNQIIQINKSNFNPYSDDIYSPELITNITWNKPNTLLIIVGDLIDGARNIEDKTGALREVNEVDDPRGSFELRLHLFIFNMRIKAMQRNSEVRFTMGNHDHSLFCNNEPPFYMNYIHSSSMRFFNRSKLGADINSFIHEYNKQNNPEKITIPYTQNDDTLYTVYALSNIKSLLNKKLLGEFTKLHGEFTKNIKNTLTNRKNILKPFYKCSPYYYTAVKFKNSPKYEVFCIHAGVRNENINILYELQHNFILNFDPQRQVDLNDCTKDVYSISSKYNNIEHPLFERNYATLEESCNEIPFHIKKLVIGHCITHSNSSTATKIKGTPMYTYMNKLYTEKNKNDQCKNKGCILSGCNNQVIFVDTGMAKQNNNYEGEVNANQSRDIELLLLEKQISTDSDTGFSQQNFKMNSISNGSATPISGGNHTHVGGLSLFIAKQKKNHRKTRRRNKHKRAVTNRKKSHLRP